MNITDATLNDPSREDACGAPKIRERLRVLAVETLWRPGDADELSIVGVIFLLDSAIEAGLLREFAYYASCFTNWLARGEDGAGVDWPEELEEVETRG